MQSSVTVKLVKSKILSKVWWALVLSVASPYLDHSRLLLGLEGPPRARGNVRGLAQSIEQKDTNVIQEFVQELE
jgi:hypothetical protein